MDSIIRFYQIKANFHGYNNDTVAIHFQKSYFYIIHA